MLGREGGPRLTRSEAEDLLLALVRRARLPVPEANAVVAGVEVDFYWPAERLVVETDGFVSHSSRTAFEQDRDRDQALAAAGVTVMRLTWRQLSAEPDVALARLAQALAMGAAAAGALGGGARLLRRGPRRR